MSATTKIYHIACSVDDNYINHCLTMVCSLLENSKDLSLHLHILIENLSSSNQNKLNKLAEQYNQTLTFHIVDTTKLEGVRFRNKRPLSKAAYYRILLPSILNNIDKVLYLDVDIVIIKSIKELLDTNISEYPLAAVADSYQEGIVKKNREQLGLKQGDAYFNSGVMLINLNYWRGNNCEPSLIEFAKKERHVYFHDQDALNFLFKHKWLELSPRYNKCHRRSRFPDRFIDDNDKHVYKKNPVIIHFAGGYNPEDKIFGIRYEDQYLKFRSLSGAASIEYHNKSVFARLAPLFYDISEMIKRKLYIKHITNLYRELKEQ